MILLHNYNAKLYDVKFNGINSVKELGQIKFDKMINYLIK